MSKLYHKVEPVNHTRLFDKDFDKKEAGISPDLDPGRITLKTIQQPE